MPQSPSPTPALWRLVTNSPQPYKLESSATPRRPIQCDIYYYCLTPKLSFKNRQRILRSFRFSRFSAFSDPICSLCGCSDSHSRPCAGTTPPPKSSTKVRSHFHSQRPSYFQRDLLEASTCPRISPTRTSPATALQPLTWRQGKSTLGSMPTI